MENAFITELKIHKVRHLHDIVIPLSKNTSKHLILTGKNGSGKTSVLNSLVDFISHIVTFGFPSKDALNDAISNVSREISILENSALTQNNSKSRQKLIFEKLFYDYELQMVTSGVTISFSSLNHFYDKYSSGDYIIAAFKDARTLDVEPVKNIEKFDLQPIYPIAADLGKDFVKYLVNLKATQALAYTQNQNNRSLEIQQWFDRFTNVLQMLFEDPTLQLDFDIDTFQFHILMDGREPFDFNTMSMGYSAVFNIICDLMMRMESKKNYNMEGLVLIDEVETHLHVDLQKKIMPILTELFPNIQFILTTHSPFVLNSLENAVIYDLEKHLLIENGLANLPYEGIVESYFDVDTMSKTLSDKFNQYKALLQKSSLTAKEHAELAELEMYLDEVPDYLALDFAVEYEQLKLEAGR